MGARVGADAARARGALTPGIPRQGERGGRSGRRWAIHRGMRVLRTLARAALARHLALAPFAVSVLGCNGRATKADCEQMLDKYLDMVIADDPELAKLPPAQKQIARDMKRAVRKAQPSYRKVFEQCEAEITKKEHRCAMAAPNPNVWESCID